MQIALVGCGSVAAIHAVRLRTAGVRIASVCGSSLEKARAFAAAHGIEHASADLDSALNGAQAAIIASPSLLHYEQARRALLSGAHVLVELPPCASLAQAEDLAALASESKLVLRCCHTSRYLEPYRRIRQWIAEDVLGEIRQILYFRGIVPLRRSWIDDALLHHAAHPIDLLLDWFAAFDLQACVASPVPGPYRDVNVLARLPNGASATVAVSYTVKRPIATLILIGERHTIITDGFSSVESDQPQLEWRGDGTAVYEEAIARQDLAFLHASEGGGDGIPWEQTMLLMRHLEAVQRLSTG